MVMRYPIVSTFRLMSNPAIVFIYVRCIGMSRRVPEITMVLNGRCRRMGRPGTWAYASMEPFGAMLRNSSRFSAVFKILWSATFVVFGWATAIFMLCNAVACGKCKNKARQGKRTNMFSQLQNLYSADETQQ
jgi:hypothetical protein